MTKKNLNIPMVNTPFGTYLKGKENQNADKKTLARKQNGYHANFNKWCLISFL